MAKQVRESDAQAKERLLELHRELVVKADKAGMNAAQLQAIILGLSIGEALCEYAVGHKELQPVFNDVLKIADTRVDFYIDLLANARMAEVETRH